MNSTTISHDRRVLLENTLGILHSELEFVLKNPDEWQARVTDALQTIKDAEDMLRHYAWLERNVAPAVDSDAGEEENT